MVNEITTTKDEKELATQESSRERNSSSSPERTVTPRASVYETQDAVILELEMPGTTRDSIEVKVENDELTVTGRRFIPADEGLELLHQERLPFNYRRSFVLSDRIDPGNISASCNNGVLKLTLPKSAAAKPRKIAIE